ncbi:hypothetical protein JKP88DRAFT_268107 [Tribonema minus]|uniref:Uncharacterized protein n=1 Tax=Tribonema minus TaxID=303371 RepID=A0A835Z1Y0_9STRA|nr:hypothetical protein JKP88DRAFT_268107 [Tribonema minus]
MKYACWGLCGGTEPADQVVFAPELGKSLSSQDSVSTEPGDTGDATTSAPSFTVDVTPVDDAEVDAPQPVAAVVEDDGANVAPSNDPPSAVSEAQELPDTASPTVLPAPEPAVEDTLEEQKEPEAGPAAEIQEETAPTAPAAVDLTEFLALVEEGVVVTKYSKRGKKTPPLRAPPRIASPRQHTNTGALCPAAAPHAAAAAPPPPPPCPRRRRSSLTRRTPLASASSARAHSQPAQRTLVYDAPSGSVFWTLPQLRKLRRTSSLLKHVQEPLAVAALRRVTRAADLPAEGLFCSANDAPRSFTLEFPERTVEITAASEAQAQQLAQGFAELHKQLSERA